MNYYSKEKLKRLDGDSLSFGICNNLLDSAFNILQHPFELLRNERKGYGRRKDIEEFELLASFQSIVTAIELIMKSKIAAQSWKYLFSNQKKISRDSLINGEFRSINFENCIDAIETHCNVKIDDRIKSRVEEIRIIRNKITHYYFDFSADEILNYIAFGLDIYIDFYRTYVKSSVFDAYDRTEGFEEDLSDIHQFVTARIESAKIKEGNVFQLEDGINKECQKCWTGNLVRTKSNEIKCLYCGNQIDIEEFAKYHADDNTEITTCRNCQKKTVIIMRNNRPKCIICGDDQDDLKIAST